MGNVTMFVNGKQVWESAGEGVLVRNVSLMTAAGEAGRATPAEGNIEIIVNEMVAGDSNQYLPVVQEAKLEGIRKDEKEYAGQVSDREAPVTSTQRKLLDKGEDTESLNTKSIEKENKKNKENPTDETSPETSTPTDEQKAGSGTTQSDSDEPNTADSEQPKTGTGATEPSTTKKVAAKLKI